MLPRFLLIIFLRAVFCFLFVLVVSRIAYAAEWFMQPSVKAGREYNDNITYTLQPHNAVYGTSVGAILDAGVRSDIWQVNGNVDYRKKSYSSTNLDSNDHSFNLSSFFQTPRSVWQLNGTSAKSSLVTEQQSNVNTGLTQKNIVQDTRNISPMWTWSMTEVTRIRLAYQVSDVSYVNGEGSLLYDYRQQSTTVSILHQLNPQDLITIDTGYSYFRVPKTGVVSRGPSVQAGLTRQFSETLKGSIAAGARKTTTIIPSETPLYDYPDQQSLTDCVDRAFFNGQNPYIACITGFASTAQRADTTNITYNINLEKKFSGAQVNFFLTRTITPTASGAESKTNSLNLDVTKPLTQKLTASFKMYAYRTSTIGGNISSVDRQFYQFEPRLNWRWTEELSLNGSYRYSHLKRENDQRSVIANSVYLTLMYQWPRMGFSR